MKPEFSLVVPFYNEEDNVEKVCNEIVDEFDARGLKYELITVNNGSIDKTHQLLNELSQKYPQIKVVNVIVNEGYGYGVLQGLKIATGEYVGYSTGDGQISAADVAKVFKITKEENMDFCQGKRIRNDTLLRRMNTIIFNFVFHVFFHAKVRDIGSNPKILKRKVYEAISPVSKDWFIDGEIILKTHLLGCRTKEIAVAFRKREEGKSHINILSILEMLKNITRWKFKTLHFSKTRLKWV